MDAGCCFGSANDECLAAERSKFVQLGPTWRPYVNWRVEESSACKRAWHKKFEFSSAGVLRVHCPSLGQSVPNFPPDLYIYTIYYIYIYNIPLKS